MKEGNLVERTVPGSLILYGVVVWAGRSTYLVAWENETRTRVQQGYSDVRLARDQERAAVAVSKLNVPGSAAFPTDTLADLLDRIERLATVKRQEGIAELARRAIGVLKEGK